MLEFDSLDDIQGWVLDCLLTGGQLASPRGLKTLEVYPLAFVLTNPRRRCVTNLQRKWKFAAAVGEFAWHASGSKELSFISYYLKKWEEFTDGSPIVAGSCYGHKIFKKDQKKESQWDRVLGELRRDPFSRRAVITLYDEQEPNSFDHPCACMMQFLIRSGRLQLMTTMRSNDAIWGLPYDIFVFTMLQELMACQLGLEVGTYYHTTGSMHLYERHFDLAHRILRCPATCGFEMPDMREHFQLGSFLERERALRLGRISGPDEALHPYWSGLSNVLAWYRAEKFGCEDSDIKAKSVEGIYGPLLK